MLFAKYFCYKMHTLTKQNNNRQGNKAQIKFCLNTKGGNNIMETKFSGKASRLSWELFKRTGKVNYYLLYKGIETAPELELTNNDTMQKDEGLGR